MATSYHIYIWKKAPYLRLLIPFITGILLQNYLKIELHIISVSLIAALCFLAVFTSTSESFRYRFRFIQGISLFFLFIFLGAFITWQKAIPHHANWYGNHIEPGSFIIATIKEPTVEKPKSFKALVTIKTLIGKEVHQNLTGKALIYFAKDETSKRLKYGDKVIFRKSLQEIKNSGNPGAFDYKQYCTFQQIFQQVFLQKNEWVVLEEKDKSSLYSAIFRTRDYILNTLDNYIRSKDESSLAKALLIGYRSDLDKDLLQAYSNTGVVHLIAISGMHLGVIYFSLLWIFTRIPFIKESKVTKLVLVLFCLWFFALLTGAPASVLRSAVMFTFIAFGKFFNSRNSIYNSLAVSALVLLCFDPFMLWDVGFQLSYLAVLGIVVCQKYIHNWLYFENRIMSRIWDLASVSLAAQVFTLPVCIYYFHQFPLLFLLSNMIAIPLSTIILGGCIALVALSPVSFVAVYLGKIILALIWLLNQLILAINSIPFSLWSGLSISITETIILYLMIISGAYWLIKTSTAALKISLLFMIFFAGSIAIQNWQTAHQKKLIVYNIARHKAIDFVHGYQYHFVGDAEVIDDATLKKYNIEPARIELNLRHESKLPGLFYKSKNFYQFHHIRIAIIDSSVTYQLLPERMKVDYIIISNNPSIRMASIASIFDCNKIIFDASNTMWKIEQWKKECEELHLRFHSVPEQDAFVIDI